jgi:hypothetical protein
VGLSQYLADTTQLLNDPNYTFVTQNQLIRWINEARRQAAKRTGCVRRFVSGQSAFGASAQPSQMIPGAFQPGALPGSAPSAQSPAAATAVNGLMTIPGVERYPYNGMINNYLRAQHQGVDYIMDTITVAVNWGGTNRPVLDWQPWDNFQAYLRSYAVLNTSYPSIWSVFNDGPSGEIWLFPVPSTACEMELDVLCSPKALNNESDFDAIPDVFRESIKFGAAALQYMATRRYAEAQLMEDIFADRLGVARVAVDMGKTPSYYFRG